MSVHSCISCGLHVRPKQHAVQCDGCDLWQHKTCDTGITLLQYRTAEYCEYPGKTGVRE